MELYTIKDFILYNNPCKCCGKTSSLSLLWDSSESSNKVFEYPITTTKAIVDDGDIIYFDIIIKYNKSNNFTLIIDAKSNRLFFSNVKSKTFFENLTNENKFWFFLECRNCKSAVESSILEYNVDIIKPIKITYECFILKKDENIFTITSNSGVQITTFEVANQIDLLKSKNAYIELPYMPLNDIKNRKDLEETVQFLTTFM